MGIGGLIWVFSYYYHNDVSQQLQIIEEKDFIFNDILEARRYEKNYFLTGLRDHLNQAQLYAGGARQRLETLLAAYSYMPAVQNLRDWRADILAYENSLTTLQRVPPARSTAAAGAGAELGGDFRTLYTEFHMLGRKRTSNIEKTVSQENRYVQSLISQSKLYHFRRAQ